MTSIDDFVDHRWEDAKEKLTALDPAFVSRLESEHRVQALGLGMPQRYGVAISPKRPLSTEWHRLLESCLELTMQVRCVQVAAAGLTPRANAGVSAHETGIQVDYHYRSWFIHATALYERTDDVINKTTNVYMPDRAAGNEMCASHREQLRQRVAMPIRKQRTITCTRASLGPAASRRTNSGRARSLLA